MWFTKVSIKNPYFATVIMLAILFMGIVSIKSISVEEFPDVKFPVVVVSASYKGASPEVVEVDVSKPLEEGLYTLNGIKEVRSYSFDGLSTVVAEFNLDINPDTATQDVRDKVASITPSLKKEIDTPVISKVNPQDNPIMSISFASNSLPLRDITTWVNQVAKKQFQSIPGVGDVTTIGGIDRQIRINLDPEHLNALGISATDILTAIKNTNNNYPAGAVKTKNREINVQLNGRLKKPSDFADIVITYRNDVPIKISDVATVVDGQDNFMSIGLVNGKKAVNLQIKQTAGSNLVDIANNVYQMINKLNKIKPQDMQISVINDQSEAVKSSLKNVEENLIEGSLLTILIVFIFLKSWRSTVITGLTLPIALLGTVFAVYTLGFTLNMMTLLALSLSIGILIDDAIVVRENIVRHLHMGKSHVEAALDGTKDIALAVVATTLTLIAVFFPVGMMHGIIGKFFFQFGITVVVAVIISLLVSFSLDPMLSSIWHEPKNGGWLAKSFIGKILDKFEQWFDKVGYSYERLITKSITYKKTTLFLSILIFILSFMLVPLIGGEFMPQVDKGKIQINFKTNSGANIDYTLQQGRVIQSVLQQKIPQIESINLEIAGGFGDGVNNGTFTIYIGKKNTRNKNVFEVMDQIRLILGSIGGIEIKNISTVGGPGGDQSPIQINIKGDNLDTLKQIANDLAQKLKNIPEVIDLTNSISDEKPAFSIQLNRDIASNLGVNLADVGNTVSVLFAGNKVSAWEDPLTGQNYDVWLQVPEEYRNYNVLDMLRVPTNQVKDGIKSMVALSTIATLNKDFSPNRVDHYNLHRKITLTGNIGGKDKNTVFNKIQNIVDQYKLPNGYEISQNGDREDMQKSFMYAVFALFTGVIFIYMILTALFRSFILPMVIMVSLPLSFIGVFIALYLFGSTLNMFSIIGIIMLMGLATKNGILLVDCINQQILAGVEQTKAIINAGKIRLRPIIMTSFAMIFGMLPLALSHGESSEVRKPMAYAIIGGMTTSTILTLVIIPVVYIYFDKLRKFIKRRVK
jgi:HAE1 family hydrophobic/amphiphilic exporter-1